MPPPVPERVAAKAAGERFYETGKPCRNGHIGKRYTANGLCVACSIRNVMAYQKRRPWHPARIAARDTGMTRYSTGRPCQNGHLAERFVCNGVCVVCAAGTHAHYLKKRPGLGARWARDRRAKNPEPHRAEVKRWIAKNPDKHREYRQRTLDKDRPKWRSRWVAYVQNRRARVTANGGSVTPEQIEELRTKQKGRCAECHKRRRLQIDHVVAVINGGSGDISNLQLLCGECNKKKGARDPIEWAQFNGRLL